MSARKRPTEPTMQWGMIQLDLFQQEFQGANMELWEADERISAVRGLI